LLAVVEEGDSIELDVDARKLDLNVPDTEIKRRLGAWKAPKPVFERGYYKLYFDHVMQADRGADLDFLPGGSGAPVPRDSH